MTNEKNNATNGDDNIKYSSSGKDDSFAKENDDKILKEVEETFNEKKYKKPDNKVVAENDEGNENNNLTKKAKKQKKSSTYEKTTWTHKMKVLAILAVLGVFTGSGLGVYYFNNFLRANVNYLQYNPSDYIANIDDIFAKRFAINTDEQKENWLQIAKDNNTTPSDLTPVDNMLLAEYNAKKASSYEIVGTGSVATIATQTVYSERKFDGEAYAFQSISKGMLTVATCDYMKGGKNVEIYNGANVKVDGADWNYSQTITLADYKNMAGTSPSDIQPYIISDKTVISSTDVVYDEATGLYSFTLSLDPITSVLLYYKQVRRSGNLEGDPEFEYIHLSITIDENWNFVSSAFEEKYTAIKFGLPNKCVGTLNSTYKFNDVVTLPTLNK